MPSRKPKKPLTIIEGTERDPDEILGVDRLVVHYETIDGVAEALNEVSLSITKGQALGLVGETGAGKTTLALSVMGLLPYPPSHIIQGRIYLDGEDMSTFNNRKLRSIRGKKISMIFQDPMTALNPVLTVGSQIAEVVRIHEAVSNAAALAKAKEMLRIVGIPDNRYKEYPHQFSGGMKQRVVIAKALACDPELLIADEPTTALDVTIQAQVLELMKDLQRDFNTSLLMITHDFGVVADICDSCAVIYAGEIVEYGSIGQVFNEPKHPYTLGLFASLPALDKDVHRLKSIRGLMSDPMSLPKHCSFYDRCDHCTDECMEIDPNQTEIGDGHLVKCLLYCKKDGVTK